MDSKNNQERWSAPDHEVSRYQIILKTHLIPN